MRSPPKRKNRAVVRGSVEVRKGGSKGPVVHKEDTDAVLPVPIAPGAEEVGVGFDLKYWASDQNSGMTVGATSFVKLSCSPYQLDEANDVASELAYHYLHKNANRVRRDLNKFLDAQDGEK